jgi:hypothetical protein
VIRGDRLPLLANVDAPGSLIRPGRPGGSKKEEENNVRQSWRVCHIPADAVGHGWLWLGHVRR